MAGEGRAQPRTPVSRPSATMGASQCVPPSGERAMRSMTPLSGRAVHHAAQRTLGPPANRIDAPHIPGSAAGMPRLDRATNWVLSATRAASHAIGARAQAAVVNVHPRLRALSFRIMIAIPAGSRRVPPPVNEPVKSYAPGTPERAALKTRLAEMAAERIDIPLIIGGGGGRSRAG